MLSARAAVIRRQRGTIHPSPTVDQNHDGSALSARAEVIRTTGSGPHGYPKLFTALARPSRDQNVVDLAELARLVLDLYRYEHWVAEFFQRIAGQQRGKENGA
ncbi:hypothetical protein ACGFY7_09955 [Streptomyces prunicolor]|uniref:hypothetical protein n=1 Tax=Streptomyces prunicolor TaxID=67348 RepID=UPI00371AAFBA